MAGFSATLRNRALVQAIELGEDSVVITERSLQNVLRVWGGRNTIQVYAQDRIGNASGEGSALLRNFARDPLGRICMWDLLWHSLGIQDDATVAGMQRFPGKSTEREMRLKSSNEQELQQ